MKKIIKAIPIVYLAGMLAILFVIYFVYYQFRNIDTLKERQDELAAKQVAIAVSLTKLEGTIGYAGFIHHFKNFIIRGENHYYQAAQESYSTATTALEELQLLLEDGDEFLGLKMVQATLFEYRYKLDIAREKIATLKPKELDTLIQVDDSYAKKALTQLRTNLTKKLSDQTLATNGEIDELTNKTLVATALIIPFFLLLGIINIQIIRRFREATSEMQAIFNSSPDGIFYINEEGQILQVNRVGANIFGYTSQELLYTKLERLIEPELREKHCELRKLFMQRPQSREMGNRGVIINGLKKNGDHVQLSISIASTKVGDAYRCVCIVKDITKLNKMKDAAERDHLTSLYNRRYFDEVLQIELQRNEREQSSLSLILIDLDHFKELNDLKGHAQGDLALIEVAKYLQESSRSYDHVTRWGGDEFALICPNLSAEDALNQGERLRTQFKLSTAYKEDKITMSIGIATANLNIPMSPRAMIAAADKAVYKAKKQGRDCVIHINQQF